MKKVLMWTAAGAAVLAGGVYAYRWFDARRGDIKRGLRETEQAVGVTARVLEKTEQALHSTRETI